MAYVEQVLVPTLAKGDIVFMDNLRTHKIGGGAPSHRRCRRNNPVSARLFARPQSNRNGILGPESRT
jgi:hypothetical protein